MQNTPSNPTKNMPAGTHWQTLAEFNKHYIYVLRVSRNFSYFELISALFRTVAIEIPLDRKHH